MTTILETARLIVRTWTLFDASAGFRVWGDAEVMRYIGAGRPFADVEQTRGWLQRMMAHQERHGFCYWALVEKESRRLLGSCGMAYPLDGGARVDFGYTLSRSHWGRGLMTEAAGACAAYAFEQLHLPQLVASVDSRNTASRRVLEKIGFLFDRTEQLETGVDLWYIARRPETIESAT